MREEWYEPPRATLDAVEAYVEANNSDSASALLDELREFLKWLRKDRHPTERKVDLALGLSDAEIEALRKAEVETDNPYNLDDLPD